MLFKGLRDGREKCLRRLHAVVKIQSHTIIASDVPTYASLWASRLVAVVRIEEPASVRSIYVARRETCSLIC